MYTCRCLFLRCLEEREKYQSLALRPSCGRPPLLTVACRRHARDVVVLRDAAEVLVELLHTLPVRLARKFLNLLLLLFCIRQAQQEKKRALGYHNNTRCKQQHWS